MDMNTSRQVRCGDMLLIGTICERWSTGITRRDSTAGVTMIRFKSQLTGCVVVAALALAGFYLSPANGAVADVNQPHPATGVGSCTLKNPHPKPSARDLRKRIQTYRPDNYDCDGAEFARPGAQFRRFPQPRNYHITNRKAVRLVRVCK